MEITVPQILLWIIAVGFAVACLLTGALGFAIAAIIVALIGVIV